MLTSQPPRSFQRRSPGTANVLRATGLVTDP